MLDVEPQAPLGGPDGKKDIIAWRNGKKYVAAVYFPPTKSTIAEITRKYKADLQGVQTNEADGFIFMVNQHLTPGQRKALLGLRDEKIDQIFDLERIRAVLDHPSGYGLRLEYLHIPLPWEEHVICSELGTGIAARATSTLPVTGRSPFDLGVHRAIRLDSASTEPDAAETLPPYVRRQHDAAASQLLSNVERSVMVLFIGGSSTGKTRACLEAVTAHLPDWALMHPLNTAELLTIMRSGVAPRTVLWLNETQKYLEGGNGAQLATELTHLLSGDQGPVVVIGSMWPDRWERLTARPVRGEPDQDAHTRELLESGHVERLDVPSSFSDASDEERACLSRLAGTDPRLADALRTCGPELNVTQVLAGGPKLLHRYEHDLDPLSQAVITAALHARRLGYQARLPPGLLETAVQGYLTPRQRVADGGWLTAALAKACEPVLGIGALEPSRTSPGVGMADGYEPHDFLLQHSRVPRQMPPPASLWEALAANCPDNDERVRLADHASFHGLYRLAVEIAAPAAQAGDAAAMQVIAVVLERTRRREESLHWWRRAAKAGGVDEIEDLLDRLQGTGRIEEVERWQRALASMMPEPPLEEDEDDDEASLEALWSEAEDGNVTSMEVLAGLLDMKGEYADAEYWWRQVAEAGHVGAMLELADRLSANGHEGEADRWLERAKEHGYRPSPPRSKQRVGPPKPPSVWAQIDADCRRQPEETVHRWRREAQIGERRAMHELVYALERVGRAKEAKQVQRYGMVPGGMTAAPWDDRPFR